MSASASNIKIKPINASWVIEEEFCVDMIDSVAADLDGKYFNIYDGSTSYYVWFDLDTTSTDPAPGGTGIEAAIATGDSVATMLGIVQTAIELGTGYTGRIDDTRLFSVLDTTEKVLLNAADVDTGLSIGVVVKGGATDLGLLDGNVEPNFTEDLLDVLSHQSGTSILSQLRQGNNADVTLALKECRADLSQAIFEAGGATFTPPAGTELYGWGDSKQGSNTLSNSRRLVLHPVANDASDHSEDLTFWLAYPNPDSIVYSGEDFNITNVSFTTFLDLGKPKAIRRFAFGDSTQTGISV